MGLFDGTALERPVTCERCERPLTECDCPRDADGVVRLPGDQRVTVRLEKRRRGKVVTTVSGLDPHATDIAEVLRNLKQRCATGGTAQADGAIEVQGDHRERVAEVLRELGFPLA